MADIGNTGSSANLTRSASLRTERLRNTDDDTTRVELRRDREKEREKGQFQFCWLEETSLMNHIPALFCNIILT